MGYKVLVALLFGSSLAAANSNVGLVGGGDNSTNTGLFADLVSASGKITSLDLSAITTNGIISDVAMNSSGSGILGGQDGNTNAPLGAFVSLTGAVTNLDLSSTSSTGFISSVAINSSGNGILGGTANVPPHPSGPPIGILVSASGQLTNLNLESFAANGFIDSVAINASGNGILGGRKVTNPLGFILSPGLVELDFSSIGITHGGVSGVAINASGNGLLGGTASNSIPGPPLAALVSPFGGLTRIDLSSITALGGIASVAINSSGIGLLGGVDYAGTEPPLGVLVSPEGTPASLHLSTITPTTSGYINSVAINASGAGILGGQDNNTNHPLGVLLSPTGKLTTLDLSRLSTNGFINSVAINDFGSGILGGQDVPTNTPIGALFSATGLLIPLNFSPFGLVGAINGVAIIDMLLQIPTAGLSGNNLALANYINRYAPSKAFYFTPAVLAGTLAQALESAAPTRNAFSLITADNTLFFLNTRLSQHSQDTRQFQRTTTHAATQTIAFLEREDELLAANRDNYIHNRTKTPKNRPYALWSSLLGAFAHQKAEHQTPAFEPTTGSALLAFDAQATRRSRLGGGAAYAFTHIHEKGGAGRSNINQELLFLYGLWTNEKFYFDGAIWGGLFQVNNIRNIEMTGFAFRSTAHPKGWQLAPHAEFGYDCDLRGLMLEPFVMLDWISNWQGQYEESGGGPLNFRQKSHYSSFLRSEGGLRFYERAHFKTWDLVFKEKASYVNKKPFHVGRVTAALVGAPGSFIVETFTTTQNLGVAELELLFAPHDPRFPYGSIDYQGEFGSKYQSHQGSLNVCWDF